MDFILSITGFLMAIADTMPGLSGGSICFIMGYYDLMLTNIKNLLIKDKRKEAIKFLLQLGFGWIIGMILGIFIIEKLIVSYPYQMISFFLGLVLFSIPITFKGEIKYLKHYQDIIFLILGFILVVLISSLGQSISFNITTNIPIWFYFYAFIVSIIAISAMLLPGISGSSILLIFGIYQIILSNVKMLLTHFNFNSLLLVIVVILGIIIGAFSISKIISNAFKKYRGKTLYFIMGMMLGSLIAIYNAAPLLNANIAPFSFHDFNIFAFLLGTCGIILIEMIKNKFNNKK